MLLFGGGHRNYSGNEVYAFSTRSFEWTRLTDPSTGPYNRDPLTDGRPVSRHTYDGVAWIAHRNTLFAFGGSRATDGYATGITWLFEPASKTWTHPTVTGAPTGGYNGSTVYDPVTKGIYFKDAKRFHRFDPDSNTWKSLHDLGSPPLWPRYALGNPRGTIDLKRRRLWFVGGGLYLVYDLDKGAFVTDEWVTTGAGTFDNASNVAGHPEQRIITGGGDVISKPAPGLDYDSKADQIVAWTGGAPYVLDLATKTWTRASGIGAPAAPAGTGTFGRWRYLAEYNVFILVTTTNGVHFYKNTPGGP